MNQHYTHTRTIWALIALAIFSAITHAAAPEDLSDILTPWLASHELPALAAAVVVDGEVTHVAVVGTRAYGQDLPVALEDRFHIGSDTKAMTALLAAMLVDEGLLRWDSTVAEVFPELADTIHPSVRAVTLTQLLSHTSGFPSDNEDFVQLLEKSLTQEGNLDAMRYWLVSQWLQRPLDHAPGERFAYSNMGYVVAGAMMERVTGGTWDELITQRVFDGLDLQTAGLGMQSSLGRIDAPLGHVHLDGVIVAVLPGPNADNPMIIGPAGIAHMSVLDFARWGGWHAGRGQRGPRLVSEQSMQKLQTPVIEMPVPENPPPGTPPGGGYGLGMGMLAPGWAQGRTLLYHGGSNNMNLAHLWIDPEKDIALVLMTNIGGPKANEALLQVAEVLYGLARD